MFLGDEIVYDDIFGSGYGDALYFDTVGNDGIPDKVDFVSFSGPWFDYTLYL